LSTLLTSQIRRTPRTAELNVLHAQQTNDVRLVAIRSRSSTFLHKQTLAEICAQQLLPGMVSPADPQQISHGRPSPLDPILSFPEIQRGIPETYMYHSTASVRHANGPESLLKSELNIMARYVKLQDKWVIRPCHCIHTYESPIVPECLLIMLASCRFLQWRRPSCFLSARSPLVPGHTQEFSGNSSPTRTHSTLPTCNLHTRGRLGKRCLPVFTSTAQVSTETTTPGLLYQRLSGVLILSGLLAILRFMVFMIRHEH
jgi:hypothetical protein